MHNLVKTGSCSIVLGYQHYNGYFPIKINKLLKISKVIDGHNECKYIDEIKSIMIHSEHFCIPEEINKIIRPSDEFYKKIQELVKDYDVNIFNGPLSCFYVDYAGDTDLLDMLINIRDNGDLSFWNSYNKIISFADIMLNAFNSLHTKKICHLDIKPENIIINRLNSQYKIIDFGFASKEPFDDYVFNIRGTPGYFPKNFENDVPSYWLPKIDTNDLDPVNDELPFITNRKLVYKIDSYCLGRVLYFLTHVYKKKSGGCLFSRNKIPCKLNNILKSLLDKNINTRLTIGECLDKCYLGF